MTALPAIGSIPLFIAEVEAFGGAERSLLALSRWLHDHGKPNHVLTYRDAIGLASFAKHPLHVVDLHIAGGVRQKVTALRGALPRSAPKPVVSGYQPALHCTLAGVRGFHTLLHDTPSLFGDAAALTATQRLRIAVSNRIIGFGLRSGGKTTVNSDYLRAECRRDFGVDTHIVRMGGLSAGPAGPARQVDGPLRMLSVCRIEPNKRLDWLLRALSQLEGEQHLSARVDWHLHLVGKGSDRQRLATVAKQLGLSERVTLHGFVPDEVLEVFYDGAHLFLMPAVQGYGIPALEALQRGIPVMVHRESGVSDLLLDTPWATVMTGGEDETAPALESAIEGVMACRHCGSPLPDMPTEDSWAEEVAVLFGYA